MNTTVTVIAIFLVIVLLAAFINRWRGRIEISEELQRNMAARRSQMADYHAQRDDMLFVESLPADHRLKKLRDLISLTTGDAPVELIKEYHRVVRIERDQAQATALQDARMIIAEIDHPFSTLDESPSTRPDWLPFPNAPTKLADITPNEGTKLPGIVPYTDLTNEGEAKS